MDKVRQLLALVVLAMFAASLVGAGPFAFMKKDAFDEIMDRMNEVTSENCRSKPQDKLELPKDSVSQVPVYNKLLSNVIHANRSLLLHLHNMALNRAFYYSFIYQRMNYSGENVHQPGLMYLYMSAAADVSANIGWINGSSLLFDNNCCYPNWYNKMDYNMTLELFGPRAWRADDYNEPTNWLREPTNRTVEIEDYATGRVTNYTDESYKYCPYTRYEYDPTDPRKEKPLFWWPDNTAYKDSLRKYTYSVGVKFSNITGKFTKEEFEAISFFGPPQPGQEGKDITLPVLFAQPYFDCGRSNRWIVSMSSPVVDYMDRYSIWMHLRRPRFVAVAGMDAEFERIDINQCPTTEGNPLPNRYHDTHRCRQTTMKMSRMISLTYVGGRWEHAMGNLTIGVHPYRNPDWRHGLALTYVFGILYVTVESDYTPYCEPVSGFGFRRGGYQCVCLPGFYYPWWHDGPFQGWDIEQSTLEEYEGGGFDCLPVENNRVQPVQIPEFVTRRKRSTRLIANIKQEFMYIVSEPAEMSARKPATKLVARRKRRSADGKVEDISPVMISKFVKRYPEESPKVRRKREAFDEKYWKRMEGIRDRFFNVTSLTCPFREAYELYLPGDAAYGVDKQFEPQGRTALRIAHFLSNFLQNVAEYKQYVNLNGVDEYKLFFILKGYRDRNETHIRSNYLRNVDWYEPYGMLKGDRRLNKTHILGEVLSSVMGDFCILGTGVYFDRNKFLVTPPVDTTDPRYSNTITQEYFGPFAWREQNLNEEGLDTFKAIDTAGLPKSYVDEPWFQRMKLRWATNYLGMKTYVDKPMVRSGPYETSSVQFEHYPITYKAPSYEDGEWSRPHFRCDKMVSDWVMTYTVPFVGFNSIKTRIEFKGVVSVDVRMKWLNINQCPADLYIANAFKNTAKCDFKSQYCVPLPGRGFDPGSYKCECRQGYEYPYKDLSSFFHGEMMEEEYTKMQKGQKNRYDTLKCRIAGAASVVASWGLITCTTLMLLVWKH